MRILYLNHNVAWSGGTFFRAFECGRAIAARGHEVVLLSISPTRRLSFSSAVHHGVTVVETPDLLWGRGRTGWDPWDVLARVAHVRAAGRWDIVHSWDCRPVAILPALAARHRNRPQVRLLTDWADWWGRGGTQTERPGAWMRVMWPLETFFEEHYRNRADGTTAISSLLRDRALALGQRRDRVRLLPQGCGEAWVPDRLAARAHLGLSDRERLLIYIGKLNTSDADLWFDTIGRLFARRSDIRVAMVGNHGATIPAAVAGHAKFAAPGRVDDDTLRQYVAACDVSVVPMADTLANRARWPSKANPLLAAGRAVVMTRVGDLAALVDARDAAEIVAATADALVTGVEHVLDDNARRDALETRARALAAGELSWPRIAADLADFYEVLRYN